MPDTPATDTPAIMLSGSGMQGGTPDVGQSPQPTVTQSGLPPEMMTAPQPTVTQGPDTTQPGQQPPPPLTVAGDPEMHAAAVHHGRIGRAIDAVTKALGGSQTMHVVEQPDGSYVAQPMDSTPGERWSRIAKAALSGAAAGFANGQGPGGGARAFAAGAQTGLSMPQAQQDQTTQKAEQLEGQREKQIMFKKNMALLDIQQAKGNLDLMQSPQKFSAELQQYADTREKGIIAQHGVYLATYANGKDLSDHMQTNQELLAKHVGTGGQLDQVPVYGSDGKQVGVKIYGIPQDSLNQYNAEPQNVLVEKMSPDNKSIETSYRSYKPGQDLNSNILADRKTQDAANQAVHLNFAKLQNETTEAAAAKLKADTDAKESDSRIAHNYAEAAKDKDNVKTPKLTGYVSPQGIPLVFGKDGTAEPMKLPEGMTPIKATDMETFREKHQGPAIKTEQAYNVLKKINDNVQAGIINPTEQATAVRMAMQEAGILNPGQGVGGKGGMSSKDFHDAVGRRGIADDKINLIEKAINGAQITKQQSHDITASYNLMRHAMWRTTAEQGAVNNMKPEDVIPADVSNRAGILDEIYGRPNTSQAAKAPGQQQPVPTGKFAVRANGQVVGYADDAKGTNYHALQ